MADVVLVLSVGSSNRLISLHFLIPHPLVSMEKCQLRFSRLSLNLETSLRMNRANFKNKKEVVTQFSGTESEFNQVLEHMNETIRDELKRKKMAKYKSRI